MITGAGLTAAVAYRWKCQLNENAEAAGVLLRRCPRPTTTRSAAGPRRASSARSRPCCSRTRGAHPRDALRAELTAELSPGRRARRSSACARAGRRALERLVSLVLLGDLVSLYLAVLRGADPVDIEAIDALKAPASPRA